MNKPIIRKYKVRFLCFAIFFLGLCFLFYTFIRRTFSSYVSDADVNVSVLTATYIFNEGTFNFNIDVNDIIPSNNPYVYSFTIANYRNNDRSDVDMDYTLELLATTNLPLTYALYRNQTYNASGATNIITSDNIVTDTDGAWYHQLTVSDTYHLYYSSNTQDTYYLVIYFPSAYASTLNYEGYTENIEITINSKQVIE